MIELNRPKRLNFERFQEEFFNIEHGKSIELHPPDSNWGGFRGCYDYDLGYKLKFSLGISYAAFAIWTPYEEALHIYNRKSIPQ